MEAITVKSGPNPSGNTIRRRDQGEKWPDPERARDPRPLVRPGTGEADGRFMRPRLGAGPGLIIIAETVLGPS